MLTLSFMLQQLYHVLRRAHHSEIHLFVVWHRVTPSVPLYSIVEIYTILVLGIISYNGRNRGEVSGIFDYSPLWETMQRRGISQYYLLKNGIDNKTLDALKKNKNITMVTLEKLCRIIACSPNDVVRFV